MGWDETLENSNDLLKALISRRKLIAGAGGAVLSASLLSLEGCGGGGGGSVSTVKSPPATKIPGMVTLPKGITSGNLKAMSGAGSASVSTSGQFTAYIGGQGPQNVYVFDSAGNLLIAGPMSASRTTLNTRSMAELLAFNVLGAFVHAGEISSEVWTLLETANLSAIQTALEQAISTSGNKWATKPQTQLAAALKTFSNSILGSATAANRRASSVVPAITVKPNGIIVNPTARVSGVQVSSDDLEVCTATNDFRRRTWLYSSPLSQTVDGSVQNLPLNLTSTVLPATSGITSVLTSLTSLAAGATFYHQTSVTIDTPLSDSSATQEAYGIWVVGPAANPGDWTSAPADVLIGWWEVTSLSIIVDYLIPWVANLVLPIYAEQIDNVLGNLNSASGGSNLDNLSFLLKDVLGAIVSSESIRTEAYNGDLAGAIEDSILVFLNSGAFQAKLANLIIATANTFTTVSTPLLGTIYKGITQLFGALDLGASIFDAAVQIVDLASSKTLETFNIVVTPPKITISPVKPTVGFGGTTAFTANLIGASSSSTVITYDWTVTAGQLKNPTSGLTGTSVSTSGTSVNFIAPASASGATTATITVVAYYYGPSNPNRKAIAGTSTIITVSNQVITYGTLLSGGRYDDTGRFFWGIYTKLPIPSGAVSCNELMYNFDDTAYWGTSIPCSGTYDPTTKVWAWGGGDDIAADASDSGPAGSDGNLYFGLTGGSGPGSGSLSGDIGGITAYMNQRFGGMIIKGTFQISG